MSSIPQQLAENSNTHGSIHGVPAPAFTLFDANAVALATFLGTPAAGATLMAVNDRRLGHGGRGSAAVIAGIVVTALAILVGWKMPQGSAAPIALCLLFAMKWAAQSTQGAAVKEHVQQGGLLASKWSAFWIAIVYLGVIFSLVFLIVFIPTYRANNGPKVIVGTKDEVFYSGSATEAEAKALGEVLRGNGYFSDKGVTVLLDKEASGTVVSFVVKQGLWDTAGIPAGFDELGREAAPAVGGFPIKVRLLNKTYDVEKESSVGKLSVGKDDIYYLGSATESQAQALSEVLKSADFFSGNGADVFLSKQSDGTSLSFVVGDGVWNDADVVATFEKIAHQAAPAVGGFPLRLRLENTTLDVKKDELID
ncbi:MAG TPA: hypothetical protein VGG56_12835 [Terracidiphilus sp.]